MIAVLDACTIFNLINLSDDGTYLKYTINLFDKVQIVPVVYDELNKNKNVALLNPNEEFEDILSKTIVKFINRESLKIETEHTLRSHHNRKGGKEDGEFISTCFALYTSRITENEFSKYILKTHFITDDYPAKMEFQEFYNINQIGKILDSIDLLTIFYLKGFINKNELLKTCSSIVSLYVRDISNIITLMKSLKGKATKNSIQSLLTHIIGCLEDFSENSENILRKTIEDKEFKTFLRTHRISPEPLEKLLYSKGREKINYIRKKIMLLDFVMDV